MRGITSDCFACFYDYSFLWYVIVRSSQLAGNTNGLAMPLAKNSWWSIDAENFQTKFTN